jgi:hypothetical protein
MDGRLQPVSVSALRDVHPVLNHMHDVYDKLTNQDLWVCGVGDDLARFHAFTGGFDFEMHSRDSDSQGGGSPIGSSTPPLSCSGSPFAATPSGGTPQDSLAPPPRRSTGTPLLHP